MRVREAVKPSGRLETHGVVALAALALALGAVGSALAPLAVTALTPAPEVGALGEREETERVERFSTLMDRRLARIDGRTIFFVPPAPDEEAVEVAEEPEEEPERGPPPRPTRYGGPDVIAAINGAVWFEGDRVVRVGQEGGGVRVLSVEDAPWTVRLAWRGVEFDVEIFERTTGDFLAPDGADSDG